ncbi:hypothetical protein VTO42DRAFT_5121 [Malbranchea cinnamomea]
MTSYPPSHCCTVGVKHEGQPKGELKTIGEDIEAYIAHPADRSTKRGILLLTDVIGHRFINAQLIADQFAANGYWVVVPDLFHGDALQLNRPPDFDFAAWLAVHSSERIDPVVKTAIEYMKQNGCEKIGGVGYCFGAKYIVRFMREGQNKIDVGYLAHPSFVENEELSAIKGPLSISAAETDTIFPTPKRHEAEEVLAKTGQQYQISLYSGVEHGFAVRGDVSKPDIKFAKEQAFLQAVHWFNNLL